MSARGTDTERYTNDRSITEVRGGAVFVAVVVGAVAFPYKHWTDPIRSDATEGREQISGAMRSR